MRGAAAAGLRHRDGVRRVPAGRRRPRTGGGGGAAHRRCGRSAAAPSRAPRGSSGSGSCRAASTSSCAGAAPTRSSRSGSTATPSAGSRWGRSAARCSRRSRRRSRCCPADRPRYLMGVGDPVGLVEGIARGVDMFDCVLPTRLGRTGSALVPGGRINLRNAAFAADPGPLVDGCTCPACSGFSRAYIRHLVTQSEITRPASAHDPQPAPAARPGGAGASGDRRGPLERCRRGSRATVLGTSGRTASVRIL